MAKAKRICTTKERLYELMLYLNITQADIAKKTGLPKPTLSHYCSGKRIPAQDQLSLLSDAYGINPAWLMGYDLPMYMDEIKTENETSRQAFMDDPDFMECVMKLWRLPPERKNPILRNIRLETDDYKAEQREKEKPLKA